MSKLPRNGFRIYRSTDGTLLMDALIHGSPYQVEIPSDGNDYAPGYYDEDMVPIEAGDPADPADGADPARGATP
jgi:hypothetical protein